MRIAVNTRFLLPTGLEGLGHYTHEVLKAMVKDHPGDEFILYFDRPYDDKFVLGDNVEARVIQPPARHPLLWYWWFEHGVPRHLKRDKADVFFSPDGFASLSAKVPQAMVIHDLGFEHYPEHVPWLVGKYYRHFTPRYTRKVDHIFAVSQSTKEDIIERYGIPPSRIDVAYNGVRGGFKPLSHSIREEVRSRYSQDQPYFLFVGAMHPRKNVDRLLKAFDQFSVQHEGVRLLLTGRKAWMSADIEKTYKNMRYPARVDFLGYLEEEELALITGAAHALVYPSLFEGFGVPLLEAMSCGVPILTSQASCMPEIVGEAALLVDPTDVNSIVDGMSTLWQDAALCDQLGEHGLQRARDFNWQKTANIIYEGLTGL